MAAPISIEQPEFLRQPPVQAKTALPWGCAICDTKEDLKTCTACGVLSYCSRDHQSQHRKKHKELCNFVKHTRATVEDINARLGPCPHDPSLPNVRRLLTREPIAAERVRSSLPQSPTLGQRSGLEIAQNRGLSVYKTA